jgi:Na+-translocating ferredoxin:NAD+ oxidoreductase RnfA subunit
VDLSDVPDVVKGTALIFIIAGSLSLAFMGFAGLLSST